MLVKHDPAVIAGYLEDASGFTRGAAARLAIPENEADVAALLAEAAGRGEPVTVAGGRTGVAAGSIPLRGTLLSLERLSGVNPVQRDPARLAAGPAVRVADLKSAAAAAGCIYGPDPTETTGTLGGNVATNASGGQGFKYGTTRDHVLGVRGVLATGEPFHLRRGERRAEGDRLRIPLENGRTAELDRPRLRPLRVRKNAAGYFSEPGMDPIDLFIGSEGTLAVLTEITVRLLPAPAGVFGLAAFLPGTAEAAAWAADARAWQASGERFVPAAVEFMDRRSLDLIRPGFPSIPGRAGAVLLIEQEYGPGEEDDALACWSERLEARGVSAAEIWLGADEAGRRRLREFRHALPEAVNTIVRRRKLPKVGTDMAVPPEAFARMLEVYHRGLETSGLEHLLFGHIGECHLHVNVLPRDDAEYRAARTLYLEFARQAVDLGGTVSAEHGIGKLKHDFLRLMVGEDGLREMARVKHALDPAGILNRGNVFPENLLATP